MRLALQLWGIPRKKPGTFRGPLTGKKIDNKPAVFWSLSFGELEEETTVDGQAVPVREKVPIIMVPNLDSFKLKPYVTYRAEKVNEPPIESRDLFNIFYAPKIEADFKNASGDKQMEVKDAPKKKTLADFFINKSFKDQT